MAFFVKFVALVLLLYGLVEVVLLLHTWHKSEIFTIFAMPAAMAPTLIFLLLAANERFSEASRVAKIVRVVFCSMVAVPFLYSLHVLIKFCVS